MAKHSLDELDAEIAAIEQQIADEPRRLREEQARQERIAMEKRSTLPPSADLIDRAREKKYRANLTKGETHNARVGQAKDAVLLVMIVMGIIGVAAWLFSALQSM